MGIVVSSNMDCQDKLIFLDDFCSKTTLMSAASPVSVSGRGIKRRFRGRRVCSWKTLMKRPILVASNADA